MGPGKGRRIENDDVKLLSLAAQPRQEFHHVLGDEAVSRVWEFIQGKVLASAGERLLGQINADRRRAHARPGDGERAGISETIEELLRPDLAHIAAVLALIDEEAIRIAALEIQPVAQ